MSVHTPRSRAAPSTPGSARTLRRPVSVLGPPPAVGSALRRTEDSSSSSSSPGESSEICVSVRVRPDGAAGPWTVDDRHISARDAGEFAFDNVFGPGTDTAAVYERAAAHVVAGVMDGFHGTIFAYGMTGTGKTYSMQGDASSPGIIPRAIEAVFAGVGRAPTYASYVLRASYIEIYNERLHDLLCPTTASDEIKLRDDPQRGIVAVNLREEVVASPGELAALIARGDAARRTEGTEFNARSSRSHAVVQIVVERTDRRVGACRVSTLNLCDLAGSERAAADAARRKEGAYINKSLLTLGTIVSRLAAVPTAPGAPAALAHVPYRDSKLTRLLQPALSGRNLVSVLCTISTAAAGFSETLNTLRFAARAKNIAISAHRSDTTSVGSADDQRLIEQLKLELDRQRAENELLRVEIDEQRQHAYARAAAERARHAAELRELELAKDAFKDKVGQLTRLVLASGAPPSPVTARPLSIYARADTSTSSTASSAGATPDPDPLSPPSSLASPDTRDAELEHYKMQVARLERRLLKNRRTTVLMPSLDSSEDDYTDDDRLTLDEDPTVTEFGRAVPAVPPSPERTRSVSTVSSASGYGSARARLDQIVAEQQSEIQELREYLEDKDRIISALKKINPQR
ncbi:P-loop containing nucleoside triphosphate hydrolase protein [Dipodascopsis tothii]|uniref:P-loop containing nucleoside triphosphate hydrolase protein n=1 Tax=Dipodascopsis tothii TaxID=44089 RepID=UPI0034CEABCA